MAMKAKRCFLFDCGNDETTPDISFCRLPSDENQRKIWLQFIAFANGKERGGREYSLTSVQLCSQHFEKTCFGSQGKRLKKKSIPTLINGRVMQEQLSPTHLVPRVKHPYDLWETVIKLSQQNTEHENEISTLRDCLQKKQTEVEICRKQIHVLQQKVKRHNVATMKRKADKLEHAMPDAKRLKFQEGSSQTETALSIFNTNTSSGTFLQEIYSRLNNPTKQYSDYLKRISFELHFRSPSCYGQLRNELDKTLPHSRTLSIWTNPIKAGPGIIDEAMLFLRQKQSDSKYQLYYALMFDEIHIKQNITFQGERMTGFVDYGGLATAPETDRFAKTALFFMVNQINGNKKIPVAYALTDGLKKDMLANIIKNVLTALHNANARVMSVTCDGLPTNISAIEELGANLNTRSPTFQPWFLHPSSCAKIFVMLDPCHMIKLIRNVWKKQKTLFTSTGKKIEWDFIRKLNCLQEESGLKAANKLSSRNVNFENDKMKTNEEGLYKNILLTRKATGVKGLIITITSLLFIMDEIIMNPNEDLQYLPVYKCLQDHIEMYFGSIRGRHGKNNNPSVKQVASAVRDLLCMKVKDLITGNCCPLEDVSTQISPFRNINDLVEEEADTCSDDLNMDQEDLAVFNMDSNIFVNNIVVYVAGFVVKKLCQKLACGLCICMLCPTVSERTSLVTSEQFLLLATRDNGGLHVPSTSVVQVCKIAESSVRYWEQKGLKGLRKEAIIATCLRESVEKGLLEHLNCKVQDVSPKEKTEMFASHGMDLVKQIASEYIKVRLHHIARTSTLRANPVSNRRMCTKLVHFKNN